MFFALAYTAVWGTFFLQSSIKVIMKAHNYPLSIQGDLHMKKTGWIAASIAILMLAGVCVWLYSAGYLDRNKPAIRMNEDITAIGKKKDIDIFFSDDDGGLCRLKVEIVQENKPRVIFQEAYNTRDNKEKAVKLVLESETMKLKNGPATLNISACDCSFFKNETLVTKQIRVDMLPPQISILNPVNYLNPGGTGFITYRTSKATTLTGVYVDDRFFAGHTLLVNSRPTSVAYIALPLDATNAKTRISVYARDNAGNEAKVSMPYDIRPKKFRADKVNLSDTFLLKIMPNFQASIPQLQGKTPSEVFAYVNTTLREENNKTIQAVCRKTVNQKLWEGSFLRMRNASPTALFGDQRTYLIGGVSYGNAIHLGVDLASTAQAPIEAANNGIIVFAGTLGIYGNAVMIDHGLGLFSLYGHLSSIETTVGKRVQKGEKVGLSGLTGLAGGDHLHFSILVGGQFVNPQEWWDPHWITDNVIKKMNI